MKKLLTLLAVLCTTLAGAQDKAVLNEIIRKNDAVKTAECKFTRARTNQATGRVTTDEGTLYYVAPDRLSMEYSSDKEVLKIVGDQLYVLRGGKPLTFDSSKNGMSRDMRDLLMNCITGRVVEVAEAADATITAKDLGDYYSVTLSARQKAATGYERIALTYRKSDGILVRMDTSEFTGMSERISMTDVKQGVKIDPSHFVIPKKTKR